MQQLRPFFVDQLVPQIRDYSLRHGNKPGIIGCACCLVVPERTIYPAILLALRDLRAFAK